MPARRSARGAKLGHVETQAPSTSRRLSAHLVQVAPAHSTQPELQSSAHTRSEVGVGASTSGAAVHAGATWEQNAPG